MTMTEEDKIGIYGIWAWKIKDRFQFYIAAGKEHLWPYSRDTVENIGLMPGTYKDLNEFLEESRLNIEWLEKTIMDGADKITIGTGTKWQIYNLTSIDTMRDIWTAIMQIKNDCKSCNGKGWLKVDAGEEKDCIQRCDMCRVYDSDMAAERAYNNQNEGDRNNE